MSPIFYSFIMRKFEFIFLFKFLPLKKLDAHVSSSIINKISVLNSKINRNEMLISLNIEHLFYD